MIYCICIQKRVSGDSIKSLLLINGGVLMRADLQNAIDLYNRYKKRGTRTVIATMEIFSAYEFPENGIVILWDEESHEWNKYCENGPILQIESASGLSGLFEFGRLKEISE